jgi:hypothetical protein
MGTIMASRETGRVPCVAQRTEDVDRRRMRWRWGALARKVKIGEMAEGRRAGNSVRSISPYFGCVFWLCVRFMFGLCWDWGWF